MLRVYRGPTLRRIGANSLVVQIRARLCRRVCDESNACEIMQPRGGWCCLRGPAGLVASYGMQVNVQHCRTCLDVPCRRPLVVVNS